MEIPVDFHICTFKKRKKCPHLVSSVCFFFCVFAVKTRNGNENTSFLILLMTWRIYCIDIISLMHDNLRNKNLSFNLNTLFRTADYLLFLRNDAITSFRYPKRNILIKLLISWFPGFIVDAVDVKVYLAWMRNL